MPVNFNGTRMTRIQSNGAFQREVVQNGTLVFFLQGWTYLSPQYGSNVQFSSTYTYNVNTPVTDAFQLCGTYQSQAGSQGVGILPGNIENYGHLAEANLDYQVFNSRFGQLVRCTIDYGYPPFLYRILDNS
jgi:hypothetical protein